MDEREKLRSLPLLAVLQQLGINAEWKSRKGGTEFSGPCPCCKPKTNRGNFSFHQDGRFRCFSCSAKGRGAIDLVLAVKQCGFQQAVEWLYHALAADLREKHYTAEIKPFPVSEQTENPPFKGTYEKFAVPSDWLKKRGLNEETCKRYEVFQYDNPARRSAYSGSVMLKIRRYSDGECVGYLSRNIGEITPAKPKYCFPKGFHKGLEVFGAWQIKNEVQAQLPLRLVYLVESPFAVMKFHQLGLQAVSPYGWSVSPQQVEILKQLCKGVIFLPDRNKHAEALQSVGVIAASLWVKVPELPAGCDDPEFLDAESIRHMT